MKRKLILWAQRGRIEEIAVVVVMAAFLGAFLISFVMTGDTERAAIAGFILAIIVFFAICVLKNFLSLYLQDWGNRMQLRLIEKNRRLGDLVLLERPRHSR